MEPDLQERAKIVFNNADEALLVAKGPVSDIPLSVGGEKFGGDTVAVWNTDYNRAIPVHRTSAPIHSLRVTSASAAGLPPEPHRPVKGTGAPKLGGPKS
jgi:hypothetical protein